MRVERLLRVESLRVESLRVERGGLRLRVERFETLEG